MPNQDKLANNDNADITKRGKSRFMGRALALVGLGVVGCIATAAADTPAARDSRGFTRLEARVAALETAQTTEHRRRDFVIWQNRDAIRRITNATVSAGKFRIPKLGGTASTPTSGKLRACCLPPETSFLVCDDLHPIECSKKGGTLVPGQSAFSALTCGVGVCGIEEADQSAPGWDELFGSGGPRGPRPR